ncbi:hypothetical protein [Liquorilactobacillus hordei]|uniref:hypothetical protein n=1 Tax=Liquorilactobacillus hordei TaxID=468911 RepID=UPI0039E7ED85
MTDYNQVKPNVKKAPKVEAIKMDEPKKLKKVASATTRKKGVMERLVTNMIGPDGVPGIGKYISKEIIGPALKDLAVNSLTSAINMMFYGSQQGRRGGYQGYNGPTTNYRPQTNYQRSYSPYGPSTPTTAPNNTPRRDFNSEDYVLNSRNEALDVLTQLQDQVQQYGLASLADFYDLIGVDTTYADNNYGWKDLRMAKQIVVRGGYALRLPRLEVL